MLASVYSLNPLKLQVCLLVKSQRLLGLHALNKKDVKEGGKDLECHLGIGPVLTVKLLVLLAMV